MKDTPVILLLGDSVVTILVNESADGTPWLARYGVTIDGVPVELGQADDLLAEQFGLTRYDDDGLENAWDRVLFPALAAAKVTR